MIAPSGINVFPKGGQLTLSIDNVSTHSFRKRFATQTYTNSRYNIELVRQLLQHSNVATTQRYIGVASKDIEDALASVSSDLFA